MGGKRDDGASQQSSWAEPCSYLAHLLGYTSLQAFECAYVAKPGTLSLLQTRRRMALKRTLRTSRMDTKRPARRRTRAKLDW